MRACAITSSADIWAMIFEQPNHAFLKQIHNILTIIHTSKSGIAKCGTALTVYERLHLRVMSFWSKTIAIVKYTSPLKHGYWNHTKW